MKHLLQTLRSADSIQEKFPIEVKEIIIDLKNFFSFEKSQNPKDLLNLGEGNSYFLYLFSFKSTC